MTLPSVPFNIVAGSRTAPTPPFWVRVRLACAAFFHILGDQTVIYGCDLPGGTIKTTEAAIVAWVRPS